MPGHLIILFIELFWESLNHPDSVEENTIDSKEMKGISTQSTCSSEEKDQLQFIDVVNMISSHQENKTEGYVHESTLEEDKIIISNHFISSNALFV